MWGGVYRADDRLRPCPLTTYDMHYDASLTGTALAETRSFDPAWTAWDADNSWSDGAVVDAHAYAGWTYDYYYKRHGRRGLDDHHNLAVRAMVHPLSPAFQFANAAYDPFANAIFFGDGDSEFAPFSSALDVVAHELSHGVTAFTWNGSYQGESGALDGVLRHHGHGRQVLP